MAKKIQTKMLLKSGGYPLHSIILYWLRGETPDGRKIFTKLNFNLPAVFFIQHIFLSDYISFRDFLDIYFAICHAGTRPATYCTNRPWYNLLRIVHGWKNYRPILFFSEIHSTRDKKKWQNNSPPSLYAEYNFKYGHRRHLWFLYIEPCFWFRIFESRWRTKRQNQIPVKPGTHVWT